MSLATLIAAHGYWILALGCMLEGETVLVLAALAAHRGYLDPAAVITIAAACAFAGNQFFFWLFGEAAQTIFGHLAHVEGWLFGALIVVLVAWRLLRRRHAAKA